MTTEEKSLLDHEPQKPNTENNKSKTEDDYKYEDRLQVPFIEKEKGDKELKAGNYDQALKHYSKVSLGMKILVEDKAIETEEELSRYVQEVSVPCFLNMSFIHFKQGDWESVVRATTKVLDFEKKNIKALYRRCMALHNLGKLEEGAADLHILKIELKGTKELDDLIESQSNAILKRQNDQKAFYSRVSKRYLAHSESQVTKKERILNYFTVFIPHKISKACASIYRIASYPVLRLANLCTKKKTN